MHVSGEFTAADDTRADEVAVAAALREWCEVMRIPDDLRAQAVMALAESMPASAA